MCEYGVYVCVGMHECVNEACACVNEACVGMDECVCVCVCVCVRV